MLQAPCFNGGPVSRSALYSVPKELVTWESLRYARATAPCVVGSGDDGLLRHPAGSTTITQTNYQVNLLDPGDLYSPGY
jgi:hypothetical protein